MEESSDLSEVLEPKLPAHILQRDSDLSRGESRPVSNVGEGAEIQP